jgi:spermidine/putrescine-binding protein
MSSAYNGRIGAAQDEGHNFRIVWDNALYDLDNWAIVKGSKHKALAEQFIAFANQPENQKVFAENIPYGPTNLNTSKLLDPARLSKLPTAPENLAVSMQINSEFSSTVKTWSSVLTPGRQNNTLRADRNKKSAPTVGATPRCQISFRRQQ